MSGMDPIGWYIATMHQFLGHDKAAAAMEVPVGDKTDCLHSRNAQSRHSSL